MDQHRGRKVVTPGNSSPSQGEREGSSQGAGNRPLRKTDQQAQRATWQLQPEALGSMLLHGKVQVGHLIPSDPI